jgi:hypothetical protein
MRRLINWCRSRRKAGLPQDEGNRAVREVKARLYLNALQVVLAFLKIANEVHRLLA